MPHVSSTRSEASKHCAVKSKSSAWLLPNSCRTHDSRRERPSPQQNPLFSHCELLHRLAKQKPVHLSPAGPTTTRTEEKVKVMPSLRYSHGEGGCPRGAARTPCVHPSDRIEERQARREGWEAEKCGEGWGGGWGYKFEYRNQEEAGMQQQLPLERCELNIQKRTR